MSLHTPITELSILDIRLNLFLNFILFYALTTAKRLENRFCWESVVASTLECWESVVATPTWPRACSQDIIIERVSGGGIRQSNNRVWWFRSVASTFNWPESNGLFPVEMHKTACVCGSSANIADAESQWMFVPTCQILQHVLREVKTRDQMCIVADGGKFEHW